MNWRQSAAGKPLLRRRLLRHVLWPLALAWFIGSAVSAGVANHFAQKAFDRSLLDDAYTLAAHVRYTAGLLDVALSQGQIGSLLFDRNESNYFAIYDGSGRLLAGHAGLNPQPFGDDEAGHEFADLHFDGHPVRAVLLRQSRPEAFRVVVAQTTRSRSRLLEQLLLYSLLPELLLFLLTALWFGRTIRRDLQPLVDLEHAVEQRDEAALEPLPVDASTQDVAKLGGAINALLGRIRLSLDAQREFVGNVAHELRTPLAGMRAAAEYALQSDDPARWREQLRQIQRASLQAGRLAEQLLALALADEAELSRRREPVRLDELIAQAVLGYRQRALALGVDLGAEGIDLPVSVIASPELIEGLLNNLIDNALRYGRPSDGSAPEVTLGLRQQDGSIELVVSDNGPGLDEAECRRLVARGAQGHVGRALGQGLGLGLAIVARYAGLLQAKFWLQRGAVSGLEAHLRFPPQATIESQQKDNRI